MSAYNLKTLYSLDEKPNISYLDFTELYATAYQKLLHLPLIEKNEYNKKEKEAFETIKTTVRVNKFKGGEVDIPYTKDEPENRVNPITGEPYSESSDITEQLTKLGLNK